MLEKSDVSVSWALSLFNERNIDVGLVVPTEIGMAKSIMDAPRSLRNYLVESGYHDYAIQSQGPEAKVVRKISFVWPDQIEETKVSLYRPKTKNGDPRIWFSGLPKFAEPYNLLALYIRDHELFVINCSNPEFQASMGDPYSPINRILGNIAQQDNQIAKDLLHLIKDVASQGFIKTLRPGSTGVGMTLETLLGISANSSKAPDFKGIEIKAKRLKKAGRGNRVTLFSQVPDWKSSPIGSAWGLLENYGYRSVEGRLQLYHEINACKPNSMGFMLKIDYEKGWLKQTVKSGVVGSGIHLTTWQLEKLRERVAEKHPQTFWVSAKTRGRGEGEEFLYSHIEHTHSPKIRNFDALLEAGTISLDYTLSAKDEEKKLVRDHGYLFKIRQEDFGALFPPSKFYYL